MSFFQHVCEPSAGIGELFTAAVLRLPLRYTSLYYRIQGSRRSEITAVEVDVKHRILQPLLLQRADGQSLEEFLAPQKIVLQGGYQQALAEPPRSAQKIDFSFMRKPVYKVGLVHIGITVLADLFEALNSYRVFHHSAVLHYSFQKQKYAEAESNAN